MSARDTLTGLYTDAGFKQFGEASDLATRLYGQVRREVLDDLARSGTGLPELLEMAAQGDQDGEATMPPQDARELWHRIRGAALLQAAEQLNQDSSNAQHPKVKWTLGWAAMRVHKMIINPEGTKTDGEARRESGPGGGTGVGSEG